MNAHRFVLQPYRSAASRFHCPQCRHRNKTFKRYIDLETGNYLDDHVGRCDREEKCGYHYSPREYFATSPYDEHLQQPIAREPNGINPIFNHLPVSLVRDSMAQRAYNHNNFMLFLADVFGWENALQAAERYNIATSKHWHGATVFWQIDTIGRVRTGKVMLFRKDTGKRVKEPFNHIAWAHNLVGSKQLAAGSEEQLAAANNGTSNRQLPAANFLLKQCFFGEHLLLQDEKAPVAITESEKTAVMASIMMPGFIWLAAGSLNGLGAHKCRVLCNRNVLLFPDVGAYGNWLARACELNLKLPAATFTVHDEMEKTATDQERATGADMGDRWTAERDIRDQQPVPSPDDF